MKEYEIAMNYDAVNSKEWIKRDQERHELFNKICEMATKKATIWLINNLAECVNRGLDNTSKELYDNEGLRYCGYQLTTGYANLKIDSCGYLKADYNTIYDNFAIDYIKNNKLVNAGWNLQDNPYGKHHTYHTKFSLTDPISKKKYIVHSDSCAMQDSKYREIIHTDFNFLNTLGKDLILEFAKKAGYHVETKDATNTASVKIYPPKSK